MSRSEIHEEIFLPMLEDGEYQEAMQVLRELEGEAAQALPCSRRCPLGPPTPAAPPAPLTPSGPPRLLPTPRHHSHHRRRHCHHHRHHHRPPPHTTRPSILIIHHKNLCDLASA